MFAEHWSELFMVMLSVRELLKSSIAGTEKEKGIAKGQWVNHMYRIDTAVHWLKLNIIEIIVK